MNENPQVYEFYQDFGHSLCLLPNSRPFLNAHALYQSPHCDRASVLDRGLPTPLPPEESGLHCSSVTWFFQKSLKLRDVVNRSNLLSQLGRVILALWLLPTALGGGAALALDPQKAITQYILNSWTSADGLPQNSITAIAQTHDGYLWLGTEEGLARFDGVSFTVFDRTNTSEIKNNIILGLYADKEGSLWIGTYGGGLTRLKDEKFSSFTTKDGLSNDIVRAFYEDKEGILWIATYGGGLNKFKDGKFTSFTTAEGLSDDSVWAINEDKGGNLWIGTERGLNKFKDGKFTSFYARDGLSNDIVKRVYEDTEGNLWIGTFGGGLNRFKNGKFTSIKVKDGLSSNIVTSLYEDNEGSLWIGSEGAGLNRLR